MTEESISTLVVGLDIGSSKTVAIIGEYRNDKISVNAFDVQPSRGVEKGMITNIDHVMQSVIDVITAVEEEAECKILSLSASLGGEHIRGIDSEGMVSIRGGVVSDKDQTNVLETAGAVALPDGESVLHVLPTEYLIDQQEDIRNPVGMSGVRLEAIVHLIVSSSNAVQNLKNTVESSGLALDHAIYQGLASSVSVLSEDERNLGACVIDIGAGTTDITVFQNGSLVYNHTLPVGGETITRDIVIIKRLSSQVAESIKVDYGSCCSDQVGIEEEIELPLLSKNSSAKTMSKRELAQIIEYRYEEIFDIIKAKLIENGINYQLGTGIVLTGGGATIEGIDQLADRVFENTPIRIGGPRQEYVEGEDELIDNPKYSTVVGLLMAHKYFNFWQKRFHKSVPKKGFFSSMYSLIRNYF